MVTAVGSHVKVGTCCISPRTWPGSWLPLFRRKLFVSLKRQMRRPFACVSAVTWCYWKPGFGPTSSLQWEHVLLTKYCIVQSSMGQNILILRKLWIVSEDEVNA